VASRLARVELRRLGLREDALAARLADGARHHVLTVLSPT
jgi:hypothetical protein